MPTETEDRAAIQHLAQQYADAVMRVDADDWTNTWTEDGAWYLPGMDQPIQGRDVLKPMWTQTMAGYPVVFHWVQPGLIEIDGDTATARFYVQENIKDGDGNTFRVVGVYDDEVVRTDEGWKFKVRNFHAMYRGPVDLSAEVIPYKG
jgi:ketosteroid isomerase-like protein